MPMAEPRGRSPAGNVRLWPSVSIREADGVPGALVPHPQSDSPCPGLWSPISGVTNPPLRRCSPIPGMMHSPRGDAPSFLGQWFPRPPQVPQSQPTTELTPIPTPLPPQTAPLHQNGWGKTGETWRAPTHPPPTSTPRAPSSFPALVNTAPAASRTAPMPVNTAQDAAAACSRPPVIKPGRGVGAVREKGCGVGRSPGST